MTAPSPSSAELVAELRAVHKCYGEGAVRVAALRSIDLRIGKGEFVALMGPSGSGKSTCLNVLGCLDAPTAGEHRFLGRRVDALSRLEIALLRRHHLGFVFQNFNLLKGASALENVELPLVYRGTPPAERRRRAIEALAEVGLQHRAGHAPHQLSGGQQQRVAIARALVGRPRLLLADEPTGNLDSENKQEIVGLLGRFNREQGVTIVMVTHEADVAAHAGRVLVFEDGRVRRETRRCA
jgi:putative ABC transport system ATP-binding protein